MNWAILIREIRRARGLKQEAAADLFGVRQATLSRWESGTATPTVAMQARITELLREERGAARAKEDAAPIDIDEACALIAAASRGDVDKVRHMVSLGVEPDCQDYDQRTPLHLAAAEGREEVVALLLARGADPTLKDRWGATPHDCAVAGDNPDIADMLQAADGARA